MLNPSSRGIGHGLFVFAVLGIGLSAFLAYRQSWGEAALWLAAAIFLACFGAVQLDLAPRHRTLWLVLGLIAGVIAWLIALSSMLASR